MYMCRIKGVHKKRENHSFDIRYIPLCGKFFFIATTLVYTLTSLCANCCFPIIWGGITNQKWVYRFYAIYLITIGTNYIYAMNACQYTNLRYLDDIETSSPLRKGAIRG